MSRAIGPSQPATPWRVLAFASFILLLVYATILFMAARQGLWIIGPKGLVPFDFAEFWAAGRLAATGHAASAYDWQALRTVLEHQGAPGFGHTRLPFFYPPFLLLPLSLVMAAPPLTAAIIWIGAGALVYLGAVWLICRSHILLLGAAAAPAAFLVVCVGQNGLLSAALLGAGLALLDRRPIMAGVLIGALAYKPQFGVLLPLVLVATRRWRVILSATATVLALVLASGVAFGWDIFAAFQQATRLSHGHIPALTAQAPAKLQSVYGLAVTLGAPSGPAWGAQIAVALFAAGFTLALWRSERPFPLKAAALAASVLLVSPYSAVYDLTLPVVAIGFLLADEATRPGRFGSTALAASYAAPLILPFVSMPLGPLICVAILAVTAERWRASTGVEGARKNSGRTGEGEIARHSP